MDEREEERGGGRRFTIARALVARIPG